MGFLKPKMPPPPPPVPTPPELPPATQDEFNEEQAKKLKLLLKKKSEGYTDTILTSTQGDTSEANVSYNTLLGQ